MYMHRSCSRSLALWAWKALLIFLCAVWPASSIAAPADSTQTYSGISAIDLAKLLNLRFSYDPLTQYCLLESPGFQVSFAPGVPYLVFDGSRVVRITPPGRGAKSVVLYGDAQKSIQSHLEKALRTPSPFSIAAILIDPGHGGKDPGAISEITVNGKTQKVQEKDITLKVGMELYALLKAAYPARQILITRSSDTYPSLEQRVDMANSVSLATNQAILYVSIHVNSSFNKSAKGFEVWYLNPEYRRTLLDPTSTQNQSITPILNAMLEEELTTESVLLAKDVLGGISRELGSSSINRGVRAEEWFVVRNAKMPSILVEIGFLSNLDEAKLLVSPEYSKKIATGMASGIKTFIDNFED